MEIYNERMERVENPDLTKGYLVGGKRTVRHEAVAGREEIWHYETIAEYENGGRDVSRVIDVPGVEARDAWEEQIDIQIYHPYSAAQLEAMAQEAMRPTQQERMDRMEQQLSALGAAMERIMEWMIQTTDRKGGE